jgi:hypothetical protein
MHVNMHLFIPLCNIKHLFRSSEQMYKNQKGSTAGGSTFGAIELLFIDNSTGFWSDNVLFSVLCARQHVQQMGENCRKQILWPRISSLLERCQSSTHCMQQEWCIMQTEFPKRRPKDQTYFDELLFVVFRVPIKYFIFLSERSVQSN